MEIIKYSYKWVTLEIIKYLLRGFKVFIVHKNQLVILKIYQLKKLK